MNAAASEVERRTLVVVVVFKQLPCFGSSMNRPQRGLCNRNRFSVLTLESSSERLQTLVSFICSAHHRLALRIQSFPAPCLSRKDLNLGPTTSCYSQPALLSVAGFFRSTFSLLIKASRDVYSVLQFGMSRLTQLSLYALRIICIKFASICCKVGNVTQHVQLSQPAVAAGDPFKSSCVQKQLTALVYASLDLEFCFIFIHLRLSSSGSTKNNGSVFQLGSNNCCRNIKHHQEQDVPRSCMRYTLKSRYTQNTASFFFNNHVLFPTISRKTAQLWNRYSYSRYRYVYMYLFDVKD